MANQEMQVRWRHHQAGLLSYLRQMLVSEIFVDVTLCCQNRRLKAHRVLLSACSPYLQVGNLVRTVAITTFAAHQPFLLSAHTCPSIPTRYRTQNRLSVTLRIPIYGQRVSVSRNTVTTTLELVFVCRNNRTRT